MKAITVRQPWAWLIIHAGKDIENRTWRTNHTGTILIHAAKGMTRKEYDEAASWVRQHAPEVVIPQPTDLVRGAIIGTVRLRGCVASSTSRWFFGDRFGWELSDAKPTQPRPMAGMLGLWECPAGCEQP